MWCIVDDQWGVCSYCELSKELGIVLEVFDCRTTSLGVGAASAVERRVVVDLGCNILSHQAVCI
jgi:hypothetical protein